MVTLVVYQIEYSEQHGVTDTQHSSYILDTIGQALEFAEEHGWLTDPEYNITITQNGVEIDPTDIHDYMGYDQAEGTAVWLNEDIDFGDDTTAWRERTDR